MGKTVKTSLDVEVKVIERYKVGLPIKTICKEFKIDQTVLYNIINRNNIPKRGQPKKYVDENLVIKLYQDGESVRSICRTANTYERRVTHILSEAGIAYKTHKYRKYSFDENFFDNIDSEEKAYWLGFIFSDGNINKGCAVRIKLAKCDDSHLIKFFRSLNHTGVLYAGVNKGKNGYNESEWVEARANSVHLVSALAKWGVIENKTYDLSFVDLSFPSHLHRHFWRGVIDGDGWIYRTCSSETRSVHGLGLTGHPILLKEFSKWLNLYLGSHPKIHTKGQIQQLEINKKEDVLLISTVLYLNSTIFLDRKMNTYKNIMQQNFKGELT